MFRLRANQKFLKTQRAAMRSPYLAVQTPRATLMSSKAGVERPAYAFRHANGTLEETKRLDDMHKGMKEYFGGSLSFAPIGDATPKKILELGCGSGAWAIQAAKRFPDANVLAVDQSPIPARPLPQNLKFQSVDLTKPFPFPPETYDLVHARFVYIHLPKFEVVLRRTIDLVRPGGWLILEDVDNVMHDDGGLGPGQKAFWNAFHNHMKTKGINPLVGSALAGLLEASGSFSEMNIKKVVAPLSRDTDDMKASNLGASLRVWIQLAIQTLSENTETLGLNTEVGKLAQDEMDDPNRDLKFNLYFTWSRKRV